MGAHFAALSLTKWLPVRATLKGSLWAENTFRDDARLTLEPLLLGEHGGADRTNVAALLR